MTKPALRLCSTPATPRPALDSVNPRTVDMAYVPAYTEVLCVYAHITAEKVFYILWLLVLLLLPVLLRSLKNNKRR